MTAQLEIPLTIVHSVVELGVLLLKKPWSVQLPCEQQTCSVGHHTLQILMHKNYRKNNCHPLPW